MKKFFLGFAALLIAATVVFAFTTNSNASSKFAVQVYEYTPQAGVPNPPSSEAQAEDQLNWTLRTSAPSCNGLGSKFCRIEFNDTNTSLTEALDIIGNRIAAGQSFTHNTTYTVSGKSVKIFLKN